MHPGGPCAAASICQTRREDDLGGARRALLTARTRGIEILALDEALDVLSRLDRRKGRVVELRYFGGLKIEETAEILGVSADTVKRDWRLARA